MYKVVIKNKMFKVYNFPSSSNYKFDQAAFSVPIYIHSFHFSGLAVLTKILRSYCHRSGSDKALPMAIPIMASKVLLNKLQCGSQKGSDPRSAPGF